MNILKSDKVLKLESEGILFETFDEDGNKRSEDDMMSSAMEIAFSWVPGGIGQPMEEYLINHEYEMVLYGVGENGEEIINTYKLYFY